MITATEPRAEPMDDVPCFYGQPGCQVCGCPTEWIVGNSYERLCIGCTIAEDEEEDDD